MVIWSSLFLEITSQITGYNICKQLVRKIPFHAPKVQENRIAFLILSVRSSHMAETKENSPLLSDLKPEFKLALLFFRSRGTRQPSFLLNVASYWWAAGLLRLQFCHQFRLPQNPSTQEIVAYPETGSKERFPPNSRPPTPHIKKAFFL